MDKLEKLLLRVVLAFFVVCVAILVEIFILFFTMLT